jgi:transcriptional regulator with XRE-family HTH domain
MTHVAHQLEYYRRLHGLNRAEAAALLGIDVLAYIDLEESVTDIGVQQLLTLSAHYGVQPEAFLKKETPVPRPVRKQERVNNAKFPAFEKPDKKARAKETAEIYKKHGTILSDEEAEQVSDFMDKMLGYVLEQVKLEASWEQQLKDQPHGFAVEDTGHTCRLCKLPGGGPLWYDRYGLKCLSCQHAVERQVIPGELLGNDELYYTAGELSYFFNLDSKTLTQYLRADILKQRVIRHAAGKYKHLQMFLLSDNPGFFPPKDSLQTGEFFTETDGDREWESTAMWYHCDDAFSYIKDYGIGKYLKITGGDSA